MNNARLLFFWLFNFLIYCPYFVVQPPYWLKDASPALGSWNKMTQEVWEGGKTRQMRDWVMNDILLFWLFTFFDIYRPSFAGQPPY